MRQIIFLSLLIPLASCAILLSGCAGAIDSSPRASFSGANLPIQREARLDDGSLVQVETVEDQAFRAVRSTGTIIEVPYGEQSYAWERAKYFLKRYTTEDFSYTATNAAEVIRSSTATNNRFIYQIERKEVPKGYRFSVYCIPNASGITSQTADQNARNVSRFIETGTLEVSLLEE